VSSNEYHPLDVSDHAIRLQVDYRETFHDMRRADFEREQIERADAEDSVGTPPEGET